MAFSVQITNVSTTPASGIIVAGETFQLQCTIQNNGTSPIQLSTLFVRRVSGENPAPFIYFFAETAGDVPPVLAPGASQAFSMACTMAAPVSLTERTFVPYLGLQCYYEPVEGSGLFLGEVEYGQLTGITVLDMRYEPRIETFSAARYPTEEGAQTQISIRCTLAEGANSASEGLYLNVQWREEGDGEFQETNQAAIAVAQALAQAGTTAVLAGTFEQGKAYVFRATFGDGFDSAFAQTRLAKSFANLHLAGSGYGVAMGQYSTGTQAEPRFEFAYPALFYAGIQGVTNHAAAEVATGGRWVDGRPIYRLSGMYAGTLTNGAQNNFPLGIAPIHTVIRADVFTRGAPADGSSGYWWFPATYNNATSGNTNYSISYLINNCHSEPSLRVIVGSGADVRGRQLAYCIEYTKAVDMPAYYHLPYLVLAVGQDGCVVSSSSEFSSGYYNVYAFGGSVSGRYWACAEADAERWIQVQMPYKLKNMIVRLTNPIGGGSEAQYMPVAGTFQGSNDGSAWTQLGAFADRPTTAGGVTEHALNNAEAYKYLRVQVTQPGAGSWTGFGDIRVEGAVETEGET